MNTTDQHIIYCLRYFSFFHHPLRADEIHRYIDVKIALKECESCLKVLADKGEVFTDGCYFALNKDHLKKRKDHEALNNRLMKIGHRVGRLVGLFPFVRGVYISGSVSKSGADGIDDDIDFFIITEKNRLWTARLFLILFKKAFLFNSKKYFCVNFFKSADDLVLIKRNRYIATEAASLIPVVNHKLLLDLYAENKWIELEMPNAHAYWTKTAKEPLKLPWIEFVLNGQFGDVVENKAFRIFEKHQKSKYKGHRSAEIVATKSTSALFPNSVEKEVLTFLKK
ncbi:MAG: hypothetical protein LAT54_02440 [Cryomorphaceae bacterium]|nr:hypothetical protein [Cryomorphaceae bacterium]